jgi:hypothetical protein
LEGTGSTLFSGGLFWKFGGNWLHIIFRRIVSEVAQIWRELAPHYFPADCFGGSSNFEGTGSTLFSDILFWRQLKFGGNWLHIIFWWIVLEIWRELTPHYFPAYCFGGSSDLAETAPHYFPADCFGGSSELAGTTTKKPTQPHNSTGSDLAGTGSTLFSSGLF